MATGCPAGQHRESGRGDRALHSVRAQITVVLLTPLENPLSLAGLFSAAVGLHQLGFWLHALVPVSDGIFGCHSWESPLNIPGTRPDMLLNILKSIGWSPTAKKHVAPQMSRVGRYLEESRGHGQAQQNLAETDKMELSSTLARFKSLRSHSLN